jgi:hypothetical protein
MNEFMPGRLKKSLLPKTSQNKTGEGEGKKMDVPNPVSDCHTK